MASSTKTTASPKPKPAWLKRRLPSGPAFEKVRALISNGKLHTVCQEAHCPNMWECFSSGTATFLILGDRCTRDCRFCAVQTGPEQAPDPREPQRVAQAAYTLGLEYVVLTSVTRDDLPDGGAAQFAATIQAIFSRPPRRLPAAEGRTAASSRPASMSSRAMRASPMAWSRRVGSRSRHRSSRRRRAGVVSFGR